MERRRHLVAEPRINHMTTDNGGAHFDRHLYPRGKKKTNLDPAGGEENV